MLIPLLAATAFATSACETQQQRARTESCGDDTDCKVDLVCEQQVDLDGDGKPERVALAAHPTEKTALTLQVHWGHGKHELLTTLIHVEDGDTTTTHDLSWLMGWHRVATHIPVLHSKIPLPKEALGEGLFMTSTDVASVLVLTKDGLRLYGLGF